MAAYHCLGSANKPGHRYPIRREVHHDTVALTCVIMIACEKGY